MSDDITIENAKDHCRSINKHTEGGATFLARTEIKRERRNPEAWTLVFRKILSQAGGGARLVSAVQPGERRLFGRHIPAYVREEYCLCDEHSFYVGDGGGWDELVGLPDVVSNAGRPNEVIFEANDVRAPDEVTYGPAIVVYCEVGDSGHGVDETVALPCSEEELDRIMSSVIEVAEDAAREAGWGDDDDDEAAGLAGMEHGVEASNEARGCSLREPVSTCPHCLLDKVDGHHGCNCEDD